jgi:hypothetical protein
MFFSYDFEKLIEKMIFQKLELKKAYIILYYQ